jgi:hypothetical protein
MTIDAVIRFMEFQSIKTLGQLPKGLYTIRCREFVTVPEMNAVYKRFRYPPLTIHRWVCIDYWCIYYSSNNIVLA